MNPRSPAVDDLSTRHRRGYGEMMKELPLRGETEESMGEWIGDEGHASKREIREHVRWGHYPTSLPAEERMNIEDARHAAWEFIREHQDDVTAILRYAQRHNVRIRELRAGHPDEEKQEFIDERSDTFHFPHGGSMTIDPRGYIVMHDQLGHMIDLQQTRNGEASLEWMQ